MPDVRITHMTKYSTGPSAGGGAASCELCGKESSSLRQETVAGADLEVCSDCATHGEGRGGSPARSGGQDEDEPSRKKRAARNVAKANPIWDGDSEHWEREGTNYDEDPLPYLVSAYGDRAETARQEVGLTRAELAEELGVPEADVLAVEQGRATQAGIGGGLIAALEERLDVALSE